MPKALRCFDLGIIKENEKDDHKYETNIFGGVFTVSSQVGLAAIAEA